MGSIRPGAGSHELAVPRISVFVRQDLLPSIIAVAADVMTTMDFARRRVLG